jgi:hypothetical protein
MDALEFDMVGEDIGDVIEIIRVQFLKMGEEEFCRRIGVSPALLFTVEQGKGPHGTMVLKKIQKEFHNINFKVSVEFS